MTRAGAETTIIVASAVTFGSVSAKSLTGGSIPSGKTIASTFLAFGALGLIALPAPDLGAGLAIALAGTAFAIAGEPVIVKMFPDTKGKGDK